MKLKPRTIPCIFAANAPWMKERTRTKSHISFAMTAELSCLCGASLAVVSWIMPCETTCLNRRPDRARRSLALKHHPWTETWSTSTPTSRFSARTRSSSLIGRDLTLRSCSRNGPVVHANESGALFLERLVRQKVLKRARKAVSDILPITERQGRSNQQGDWQDLARRRYQTGSIRKRGKRHPVWELQWWADYLTVEGKIGRKRESSILGYVRDLTRGQARVSCGTVASTQSGETYADGNGDVRRVHRTILRAERASHTEAIHTQTVSLHNQLSPQTCIWSKAQRLCEVSLFPKSKPLY